MKTLTENEAQELGKKITSLYQSLQQVLVGQEKFLEVFLVGFFSGGHLLLEGLPGLGKTELVKSLAELTGLETKRIQFTPDLLPGDVTGNPMIQEENGQRRFVFQKGPLFANLVLADEINRASPKTQSALLEAMQEGQVTVLGEPHLLPKPFWVLATQNPIDLEGTYPLPEAQLDRFLLKLHIQRQGADQLKKIVSSREYGQRKICEKMMNLQELQQVIDGVREIYLPESVADYIARLVNATHAGESEAAASIRFGASPRAAIALARTGRARALMQGRVNMSFEDVSAMAPHVLGHRVILDYTAKMEGKTSQTVINEILKEVPMQAKELPKTLQDAKV